MENWKPILGYEGLYLVSDEGKVMNALTGRVLKERDNGSGYKKVELWKNHKGKRMYIHRLVAISFINNPEGKTEVNHIDGNPKNNKAENLEWVSSSENTKHAVYRNALRAWGNSSRPIEAISAETGKSLKFATISEAERFFNSKHISNVLSGKRKTCKGHYFRYLNGGDDNVRFDYHSRA